MTKSFNWKKFEIVGVLGLLVLGLFLRLFRLSDNLRFDGEMGENYLTMKTIFLTGQLPLLGPATSHPWLFFGPLFYWLFTPILAVFRFNPVGIALVMAIISASTIGLNYFVAKKLFSVRVAIISSLLITVSPVLLEYARGARFYSLLIPLFYPFFYLMVKSLTVPTKPTFFYLGLVLGVILNFHLSAFILVFATGFIVVKNRQNIKFANYIFAIVGLGLANLPFLIHNLTSQFEMAKNLALWIPYRLLGFLGIYSKNTLTWEVFSQNLKAIYDFIASFFLYPGAILSSLVVVVFCMALIFFLRDLKRKKEYQLAKLVLVVIIGVGLLTVFIHGNAPMHYFLPIVPTLPLVVALIIENYWGKPELREIAIFGVLLLVVLNLSYFFSQRWFYTNQNLANPKTFGVPYKLQTEIVKTIINDTKDAKFRLARVGLWDSFVGNYAQNYVYLTWLYGNQTEPTARAIYTIFEPNENGLEQILGRKIIWVNNVAIGLQ